MIILHIGLPKTATTFLQKRIFTKIPNILFIDRFHGVPKSLPGKFLSRHLRWWINKIAISLVQQGLKSKWGFLFPLLRALATKRIILISHEGLSIGRMDLWNNSGKSLEEFINQLRQFIAAVPGIEVKIIIGFRDPAHWFASRYAQSAGSLYSPGQTDFENRLGEVLSMNPEPPSLSWLNQKNVLGELRKITGEGKTFSYSLEELSGNPAMLLTNLVNFINPGAVSDPDAINDNFELLKENAKRTGGLEWQLQRSDVKIHLTPEIEKLVRSRFQ